MRRILAFLLLFALPLAAQNTTTTTTLAARFTQSCTGQRCTFDASPSDSLSTVTGYSWSWGDGRSETHTRPTVTNSWSAPGTYKVQLTVTRLVQAVALSVASQTVTLGGTPVPTPVPVPVPTPIPTPVPPPTGGITTPAAGEVWAELPRVYLDTKLPSTTGRIISVTAGGDLQAALNNASPGDAIELANGAVFTGNYVLPNKSGTAWIVIRPANWKQLPPEGTRMTPTIATSLRLPQILTPNSGNAITTAVGAHHFRLVGLDVGVTPSLSRTYGLVVFDAAATNLSAVPHDLVLDRSYLHGTATVQLRRCVLLNSAASAVIDSWLSDCHENGADSQAIAGWNGPGPFKIVNNYLEGAGENVIFGGADPAIPNLTPSDIEIRRNSIVKPISWKGGPWLIKNLLELKHAQRVLIEGNVLDGSWAHGQNGVGIALKTVNQNGTCPWCVTQDVTVRLNLVRNVGAGVNLAASPDNTYPDIHARRLTLTDNVIAGINVPPFTGDGRGIAIGGDLTDIVVAHNTVLSPTQAAFVFGPAGTHTTNVHIRDNLTHGGAYGVTGDNAIGGPALSIYSPGGVFAGNVVVFPSGSGYPAGNVFVSTLTALALNPDLSLSGQYKGKATDGRDPGASIAAVLNATAGVP